MQASDTALEEPHRIVVSPNRSLGPRGAAVFFLIVAAGVLTVAGIYTVMGFWPVVPFAGLELFILAVCLYIVQARGLDRQVITVDGDRLTVEKGRGRPAQSFEFNRHWVRVVLEQSAARNHPERLLLREGTRECEIGNWLNESQRQSLRLRLEEVIAGDRKASGTAGLAG